MTILPAALLGSGSTTTTTVASGHKAGTSLLDPIAKPVAWVLEHIYAVVPNYGVAILILSLLWMIIISPLTLKSTRSMLAMQKLQPQLKKLQEQHKNDKQAFAQAQMELFREHRSAPSGRACRCCSPCRCSSPCSGSSRAWAGPTRSTCRTPAACTRTSWPLTGTSTPSGWICPRTPSATIPASSRRCPFWILLLVMAGTGYLQSAQMMSRNPAAAQNPQMRLMKYLPLLFVIFFIRFPAGVLLYYAMSNVCRIVQQDAMYRFDPRVKTLVTQEVQEVEANTLEIDERQAGRGKGGPAKTTGSTAARHQTRGGSTNPSASGKSSASGESRAPTGRSRFRDLLAAATEQQQPGAASTKCARRRRHLEGAQRRQVRVPHLQRQRQREHVQRAGHQRKATRRKSKSQPEAAPKPPPKGGHRTNRKRRGR